MAIVSNYQTYWTFIISFRIIGFRLIMMLSIRNHLHRLPNPKYSRGCPAKVPSNIFVLLAVAASSVLATPSIASNKNSILKVKTPTHSVEMIRCDLKITIQFVADVPCVRLISFSLLWVSNLGILSVELELMTFILSFFLISCQHC